MPTPYDETVTTVNLLAPDDIQVARGAEVADADGQRQATMMEKPIDILSVRAAELTVGEVGPDPRFGMLVPVVTKRQVTTPGGRLMTANTSRVAELEDEANPLTLISLTSSPSR